MTTRKSTDPRPNVAAVKALLDAITGQDSIVEIAHAVTLPGRPVSVQLAASEVADYLLAMGWARHVCGHGPEWTEFRKGSDVVLVPVPEHHEAIGVEIAAVVEEIAAIEDRHPLDVAEAIVDRRAGNGGEQKPPATNRAAWDRDAEEALRLSAAATPDWNVGGLDAGDGRRIVADGPVPLDHIRVSTPYAHGNGGSRTITPEQRDADARFIAAARVGWPRDAARVRELLAGNDKSGKGKRA